MKSIEAAINGALQNGRLPCALAHRIAEDNGWTAEQVGAAADAANVKIACCQLGLFGYRAFGLKGLVRKLDKVPNDLVEAVRAVAESGKVPCQTLWKVADQRGVPRVAAGCVAETCGLSVNPCQLGCFVGHDTKHKK